MKQGYRVGAVRGLCVAAAWVTVVACGSSDEGSAFAPKPQTPVTQQPSLSIGDAGEGGAQADGATSCFATTSRATRRPLHLILLLDKSSSMCEFDASRDRSQCGRADTRWGVATRAIGSFLAAPASQMKASLVVFPKRSVPAAATVAERTQTICSGDFYDGAANDSDGLPDAEFDSLTLPYTAGISALADSPPAAADWVTPTASALVGGIRMAKARRSANSDAAVVLFTDGRPYGCSGNTGDPGEDVAAAAAAGLGDGVTTYVVGIVNDSDPSAQSMRETLNAAARAGSHIAPATGDAAIFVDVANPSLASGAITSALERVRRQAISCSFDLPAAALADPGKVNVEFVWPSGSAQALAKGCGDGTAQGWTYDNDAAPTKIALCSTTCEALRQETDAQVDLRLGCPTAGVQ